MRDCDLLFKNLDFHHPFPHLFHIHSCKRSSKVASSQARWRGPTHYRFLDAGFDSWKASSRLQGIAPTINNEGQTKTCLKTHSFQDSKSLSISLSAPISFSLAPGPAPLRCVPFTLRHCSQSELHHTERIPLQHLVRLKHASQSLPHAYVSVLTLSSLSPSSSALMRRVVISDPGLSMFRDLSYLYRSLSPVSHGLVHQHPSGKTGLMKVVAVRCT